MAGEPTEANRSAAVTDDGGYRRSPSAGSGSDKDARRSKLGGLAGWQKIDVSYQDVLGKIIR